MHYKSIFNVAVAVTAVAVFSVGCSEKPDDGDEKGSGGDVVYGEPVTYDGETYQTVVIGTQTWMAKNLNYDVEGSKCYGDVPANCTKYGRLYDWNTAKTVCPTGWHLPSDAEWNVLVNYAGGEDVAGKKLKSSTGWYDYDGIPDGNGTNNFGFSALPGGIGNYGKNEFSGSGSSGDWWSATEGDDSGSAWSQSMIYGLDMVYRSYRYNKASLLSVRCVRG